MTWNLLHMARMLKDSGGIPAHGNQPRLGRRLSPDLTRTPTSLRSTPSDQLGVGHYPSTSAGPSCSIASIRGHVQFARVAQLTRTTNAPQCRHSGRIPVCAGSPARPRQSPARCSFEILPSCVRCSRARGVMFMPYLTASAARACTGRNPPSPVTAACEDRPSVRGRTTRPIASG